MKIWSLNGDDRPPGPLGRSHERYPADPGDRPPALRTDRLIVDELLCVLSHVYQWYSPKVYMPVPATHEV
jgi:hypothetical protein